jgi:hypothetical protein
MVDLRAHLSRTPRSPVGALDDHSGHRMPSSGAQATLSRHADGRSVLVRVQATVERTHRLAGGRFDVRYGRTMHHRDRDRRERRRGAARRRAADLRTAEIRP